MAFSSILLVFGTVIPSWMLTLKLFKAGRLDFLAGLQMGFSFFVCCPLLQSMVFGSIEVPDLPVPSLVLSEDLGIYLLIFASGLMINGTVYYGRPRVSRPPNVSPRTLLIYGGLYLACSLITFFMSGKHLGGHWMENSAALYSSNPVAVVIGNFANSLRIAFPAVVAVTYLSGHIQKSRANWVIIGYVLFELLVTNNRIIILFAFLGLIAINRDRIRTFMLVCVIVAPAIIFFNSVFPMVRGLLWSKGADIEQAQRSVLLANTAARREGLDAQSTLNSFFESANLNCFKYVVTAYPEKQPYLLGETMIGRPLFFFVPQSVWSNKPRSFGGTIGKQITHSDILVLNTTILGEAWANFGLALFLILPAACIGIDRLYRASFISELGNSYAFCIALALWRFDFSFGVISLFCAYVFCWLLRRFPKKKPATPSRAMKYRLGGDVRLADRQG